MFSYSSKKFLTLLLSFAVFAQAALPLARATMQGEDNNGLYSVLCTSFGFQTVFTDIDDDTAPVSQKGESPCPFCLLQKTSHAGLSTNYLLNNVFTVLYEEKQPVAAKPLKRFEWASIHSIRAPPVIFL